MLAAQLGELFGGAAPALARHLAARVFRLVGLPLQCRDLKLQPLARSGHVGNVPARTLRRHKLPLTGGIRKVVFPELIVPELRRHLNTFAAAGRDGFVFVGVKGGQLRRSNFSKPWSRALANAGLPAEVHVHDLRHAGNTLAAEAGASLAELMSRMGHSSTRAARVYLHAREGRDQQLAATLDKMARRELKRSASIRTTNRSGT